MLALQSTTLAAVAYDPATGQLSLQFRSGSIYVYFGVPQAIHHDFMAAPSKGAYFNRHIRNQFPYFRQAPAA
jgi:KTSC domain